MNRLAHGFAGARAGARASLRLQLPTVLVAGALLASSYPPSRWWWALLALLPLFLWVAESQSARRAAGLGFAFGVGFFALNLFWLPNSLSSPELFGPVGWLIYPPLVLIEGVFWGIVTGLARALGGRGARALWLLPPLWLAMEWARTQGPFAFPWGNLAYAWLGTPVAQLADVTGSYGLSLLALLLLALVAQALLSRGARGLALIGLAAALLAASWGYGLLRLREAAPAPDRQALLVQGNTDPLGRALGQTDDLTVYTELTAAALARAPAELVIWPEGAVLNAPLEGTLGEPTRLRIQVSAPGAEVITGAGVWERTASGYRSYNSAYGLADAGVTSRYDKVYLVPFGEGVPFAGALEPFYRVVYGWFGLGPEGRTAGSSISPITLPSLAAAVYICYESVFPQVARQMVRAGAQVLVNISNDAWFGRGSGAEQHFGMGTLRAIETRRYLLRVGNDGVTAVVDPYGRTLERLERRVADTLRAEYALAEGETPYVRYGDWPVMLSALWALALAGFGLRRRFDNRARNL